MDSIILHLSQLRKRVLSPCHVCTLLLLSYTKKVAKTFKYYKNIISYHDITSLSLALPEMNTLFKATELLVRGLCVSNENVKQKLHICVLLMCESM